MKDRYLIVKRNDELKGIVDIDDEGYEKLKIAAASLEEFTNLIFLSSSYVKTKEDFIKYDFTQFNVREIDMFTMFLNALEAMAANRNLWEAYLKRRYKNDSEIFPPDDSNRRSCFGTKDSEFFDANIEYVVSKVLRNMIAHHAKPYSEIVYNDDLKRQFIISREDLLTSDSANASSKKHIQNSPHDYYDVVEVINRAFQITDELNEYIVNVLLKKEWPRFISARYTVREYIGIDWQGAYLVEPNHKYPQNHLLYLSQTNISKNAMNSICSIAAKSLLDAGVNP